MNATTPVRTPLLALILSAAPALGAAPDLLRRAHDAVGSAPGALTLEGERNAFGQPDPFSLRIDDAGRYRVEIGGLRPQSNGFDGTTSWEADWNGSVRELHLGEAEFERLYADVLTSRWLGPGSPLEFEATDADDALSFQMRAGLLAGLATFDPATGLPARIEITTPGAEASIEFGSFHAIDGLSVPAELVITKTMSNPASVTITDHRTGAVNDGFGAPESAHRAVFDANAPAELKLRIAPSGHLLTPGTIDGQNVGWFIVDTGAGVNVLNMRAAADLGLEPQGSLLVGGAGGTQPATMILGNNLRVGPVTLEDTWFIGIDLAFLDGAMGVPIAGIVGYDVLSAGVVRFDTQGPSLEILDPATFDDRGIDWRDMTIYQRHASVDGRVGGEDVTFRIDTGAAGQTVSFHTPIVERLGLLEGRETSLTSVRGVGGSLQIRTGEMDEFEFAGITFRNIEAEFGVEMVGALADPWIAGNVGGRLLDGYTIIFDYPGARVALQSAD